MSIPLLLLSAAVLAAPRGVVTDLPEPPQLEATFAPRRVALVVGVDHYDDPLLGNLRYAAKDATDLEAVLSDPALGGFEVHTLTARVTGEQLWARLDEVTADLQPDDTFLLYLAGHGTMELRPASPGHSFATEPHLFLLTSESLLDQAGGTGVPLAELDRVVAALPARRRVVVVDACYSGKGRSALSSKELMERERLRGPVPNPAMAVSRYDVRLFAADVNHPAIEAPELENGVYSHFLVSGLRGNADLDADGLVDVRELRLWARDQTMAYTGGAQVPWSHETQVGWGEIFLSGDPSSRRDAEQAILVGLEALPDQAEISVDGQPRGAGALNPGEHEVVIHLDGVVIGAGMVQVVAGERLDVSQVVGHGVPQDNLVQAGLDPAVYVQAPPPEASKPVRWQLAAQASQSWSADIIPPFGAGLELWRSPDVSNARLAWGLSADWGLGPVPPLGGQFPVASAQANLGLWWGEAWTFGPSLGLGVLWRTRSRAPHAPCSAVRRALARGRIAPRSSSLRTPGPSPVRLPMDLVLPHPRRSFDDVTVHQPPGLRPPLLVPRPSGCRPRRRSSAGLMLGGSSGFAFNLRDLTGTARQGFTGLPDPTVGRGYARQPPLAGLSLLAWIEHEHDSVNLADHNVVVMDRRPAPLLRAQYAGGYRRTLVGA